MSTTRNIIEGIKNVSSDVSAALNTKANQDTTYTKTEVDSKPTGFKNYIINGKKQINQRGLTSTDNSYNQDRWYKVGNNWYQGIEGDNNLINGKTYTLSWVGNATASYYVGNATSTTINSQSFTTISNGGSFTLTISAGQNIWVKFVSDGTGTTFNFVQLEEGSTATSFDYRPYGAELALCQRYYEKSYNADVVPATVTSTGAISYRSPNGDCLYSFRTKVEKRTTATYTIYNPTTGAAGQARNMDASVNYTVTGGYASASGLTISMSGSSGAHIQFHYDASAEL